MVPTFEILVHLTWNNPYRKSLLKSFMEKFGIDADSAEKDLLAIINSRIPTDGILKRESERYGKYPTELLTISQEITKKNHITTSQLWKVR